MQKLIKNLPMYLCIWDLGQEHLVHDEDWDLESIDLSLSSMAGINI